MRIFCLALLGLLFVTSCRFTGGRPVKGNGIKAMQERNHSNFSGIKVSGAYDVHVSQAAQYKVQVEGDQNLLKYIEILQKGSVLEVRSRKGFNLRPRHRIAVNIAAPRLDLFRISGSGDIVAQSGLSSPKEVEIFISGSGSVRVDKLDAPVVRTRLTGSGAVNLKGDTRDLYVHLSGSGGIHAHGLRSESADVEIRGSGVAEVFASRHLKTVIAGSGGVVYKGEPTVSARKSGSGSVRKID
jgi:hypothetical protein